MFEFLLAAHSVIRWLILIIGGFATLWALYGWFTKQPWGRLEQRVNTLFAVTMDVQVVIGLILYYRYITNIDFRTAMATTALRFFAVEHITAMLIAAILIHVGIVFARRAATPVAKHRIAAIFFIAAGILIAASIPWPGTPAGRALFPGM